MLIPNDSDLSLTQERLVKVEEFGPHATSIYDHGSGYVGQQIFKMNADKHCKSDFICHIDSDVVFTRRVSPQDLMIDGKPLWLMTPFVDILPTDKNLGAHVESMRKFSGIDPEFEYMRRNGQVIPRWAYGCFRDYCQERHKQSFEKYAMSQGFRGVTEFNFMGHFLHREFPNLIHFHDTRFGLPEPYLIQRWSWSGLDQKTRDEMELALA